MKTMYKKCVATMWLPYSSCVVHSNFHTATIHGTNVQGGGGIPMWLLYSSRVATVHEPTE